MKLFRTAVVAPGSVKSTGIASDWPLMMVIQAMEVPVGGSEKPTDASPEGRGPPVVTLAPEVAAVAAALVATEETVAAAAAAAEVAATAATELAVGGSVLPVAEAVEVREATALVEATVAALVAATTAALVAAVDEVAASAEAAVEEPVVAVTPAGGPVVSDVGPTTDQGVSEQHNATHNITHTD